MAKQIQIESAKERFKRYTNALDRRSTWNDLLEEAYRFTIPDRKMFETKTSPGEPKTQELFDATGVEAVQSFANNMQSVLMPPMQRWALLEAGPEIPDGDKTRFNEELSEINDKIFDFINRSNFAQAINEALQDLAIGTGVIVLNEGTLEDPLEFSSVPLSEVVFADGKGKRLDDFWMVWEGAARNIKREWPEAQLTPGLQSQMNGAPDTKVKLIIGSIHYPENPADKRFLYYVQTDDGATDIFTEFRSYSAFTGFRYSRIPGEIHGRGPALTALPFIKVVNKVVQFTLIAAGFKAYPPFLAASTGAMNPYTLRIEPGSIIPVDSTATIAGGPPLQPLQSGGDPQFSQILLENYQSTIRDILFANPLGQTGGPQMTATEVSIRQQSAIEQRGSAFGRLLVELLQPVIEKIIIVLQRKGLIKPVTIDGRQISIRYESPLAQIQNQNDVAMAQQYLQLMLSDFQREGLGTINFEVYPGWVAQKLNVDPAIVNEGWQTSPVINNLKSILNQGVTPQQQQAAQAAQPEAVPEQTSPQVVSQLTGGQTQG